MQKNSFLLGCNYLTGDTDPRTGWSLSSVQDIDTVLTNRYNSVSDDTFSLLYCDLYLRRLKEALKQTMLVHESVFESQIHELHRLYWKQKELMVEMEGANSYSQPQDHETLYLTSSRSCHESKTDWTSSRISAYQTRNLSQEDIPTKIESDKKVLDVELPVLEALNLMKEQSLTRMSLESDEAVPCVFDLNEPATMEEHLDYVVNQVLSHDTSTETGEESHKGNEGVDSVKMEEVQEQQLSEECQGVYGIDLNMSPISPEDDDNVVKKIEPDQPPLEESFSGVRYRNHGLEQSRVLVQALPCSKGIPLLHKRSKPLIKGSKRRKKGKRGPGKRGPRSTYVDDHISELQAPGNEENNEIAQVASESHNNEASMEKGTSSSFSNVKSASNRTNLRKKRRCKPDMKSSNDQRVLKKSGRTKQKSRRICVVAAGEDDQDISAAEVIVNMSKKSGKETSDCITSLGNLLWFAKIASSIVEEGSKNGIGWSLSRSHSNNKIDDFEAMTLQLTETKLEEHYTLVRMNSTDHKTAVSSIVLGRKRRTRAKKKRRRCRDLQQDDTPSLGTFSEDEANEDLQVIGKLIAASESKCDESSKSELTKKLCCSEPRETFSASIYCVAEYLNVDWGNIKKRRRGPRTPAASFEHMIINRV